MTTRPSGAGPTRQSDDRDSEPDYLLRPTRHGPGTIYDSGKDSFYLTINGGAVLDWKDTNHQRFFLSNGIFSDYPLRIRIVLKGIVASAAHPVLTPIPSCSSAIERKSEGAA